MRPLDVLRFAWVSLRGSPGRTLLMTTAMAIGVAAVVMFTALGEGARRYVVDQFASLGTNLLIVFPGRSETAGAGPGMVVVDPMCGAGTILAEQLELSRKRKAGQILINRRLTARGLAAALNQAPGIEKILRNLENSIRPDLLGCH